MHVLLAKVALTVLVSIATLTYIAYVSYKPKHQGLPVDWKNELDTDKAYQCVDCNGHYWEDYMSQMPDGWVCDACFISHGSAAA